MYQSSVNYKNAVMKQRRNKKEKQDFPPAIFGPSNPTWYMSHVTITHHIKACNLQ